MQKKQLEEIIAELDFDGLFWEGGISKPAIWADFKNTKSKFKSDSGKILLTIHAMEDEELDDDEFEDMDPFPEQINALEYLLDNVDTIQKNLLQALQEKYRELQLLYNYDQETAKDIMPDIDSVEGFKQIIELQSINIHYVINKDYAYVGYTFDCSWDNEHDLGFMTYKDRVIKVGGADTAILEWIAEEDKEKNR